MNGGATSARERAKQRGIAVVGATALKQAEPELPDDDGGDDDELDQIDRRDIMLAAARCYAAACESDTAPSPMFQHPVALAQAMLDWIEGDDA